MARPFLKRGVILFMFVIISLGVVNLHIIAGDADRITYQSSLFIEPQLIVMNTGSLELFDANTRAISITWEKVAPDTEVMTVSISLNFRE